MVALHSWLRVSAVPVLGCKFLASISSQVHVLCGATKGIRLWCEHPASSAR